MLIIKEDIFKYIEEHKEENNLVLMHCISSDLNMGAGIARTIRDKFDEKSKLSQDFGEQKWEGTGFALVHERKDLNLTIVNLVTKQYYYLKPTYKNLEESLDDAFSQLNKASKIVMPLIGCGLDKLDWARVQGILLKYSDFDITICKL